jgi:hypothetical protein
MVLVENTRAHHAWRANDYAPEQQWRRETLPLA